jgi:hypothetical protein
LPACSGAGILRKVIGPSRCEELTMSRPALSLLLLSIVWVLVPAIRGDDAEPAVGGKKLSAWVAQLEAKDSGQRRRAVLALRLLGADHAKKVAPALIKALRDDGDERVRRSAALALGNCVSRAFAKARKADAEDLPRFDDARDALASRLKADKSAAVREGCAMALGEIGFDARGAVGALATALKDKHEGTRAEAAIALRRIGREARDAAAELQEALADKKLDSRTRTEAARALGHVGSDASAALPTFKEVVADPKADVELRKAVAETLGRIGREGAEASETLGGVLTAKGTPPELRLAVVTTLDTLGAEAKAALPALLKAVNDDERTVRCVALHAIGHMGKELDTHRKSAVNALVRCLTDISLEVRLSAIEAIRVLGPDGLGDETARVTKQLEEAVRREGIKTVREAAQAALDKLRGKKSKG